MSEQAELQIKLFADGCVLIFEPGVSTGPENSDTSPGISFDMYSHRPKAVLERQGRYYHAMGVMGRKDARRLRDMIDLFLKENPS